MRPRRSANRVRRIYIIFILDQDRVSLFLKLFRLGKSRFDIKVLSVNARYVECGKKRKLNCVSNLAGQDPETQVFFILFIKCGTSPAHV